MPDQPDTPGEEFQVSVTYPDMDHAAQVTHKCGTVLKLTIEQYRGQRPIKCSGCGFHGRVDFPSQSKNARK